MGDRSPMAVGELHDAFRGTPRMASLRRAHLFDERFLSTGSRSDLGRRAESNRRESRVESRRNGCEATAGPAMPAAERLVRGTRGQQRRGSSVESRGPESHPRVSKSRASRSRVRPLVSASSRQTPQSTLLPMGSLGKKSRATIPFIPFIPVNFPTFGLSTPSPSS